MRRLRNCGDEFEMEEELFRGIVRNLSRLIILWLLDHKSYSGYGILKEMKRITGQEFRPGVVYPLLYELEKGKYIVGNRVQKGRRQTTYYSITDKGKEFLGQLRKLFELPLREMLQELLSEKQKETS